MFSENVNLNFIPNQIFSSSFSYFFISEFINNVIKNTSTHKIHKKVLTEIKKTSMFTANKDKISCCFYF